jgi:hypothetical protein
MCKKRMADACLLRVVIQGASENLPGPGFEGKLQPRSLVDRSARAAALQPISAVRAEQLGVQVRARFCQHGAPVGWLAGAGPV